MKKDFKAHQTESERKLREKDATASNYEKAMNDLQNDKITLSLGLEERDNIISQMCTQLDNTANLNQKIIDGDKAIKALQNEKAVLSAAIEARDSKLIKMSAKLEDIEKLKQKVVTGEKAQNQLTELSLQHKNAKNDIEKMKENEQTLTRDLDKAKKHITTLETSFEIEKKAFATAKKEASKVKLQFQKTRGERNTFKQKADSLAKEMSRICRNGRGIDDIERLIHDHQTLGSEVVQLRSEKKKALDEVQECKTNFDEYIQAQIKVGAGGDAVRTTQRNFELERVVTEMTEYLNAKQMQLESVQHANRSLTEELRLMAEKCRDQNDI
jgi:chromosome segregation ATPase